VETKLQTRTLALDVGDRRIGIAITDVLGLTAQPLFTLHRATPKPNLRADLKAIARFIRQHGVEVVVVGYPLNADGTVSAQSEKTVTFVEALKEFVREAHPALAFHLLDERLTTLEAHSLLDQSGHRAGKASRIERQEKIDQVAAVLLLESYLSQGKVTLLPDPDVSDRL
jgi:putative Holliday junction resolvase